MSNSLNLAVMISTSTFSNFSNHPFIFSRLIQIPSVSTFLQGKWGALPYAPEASKCTYQSKKASSTLPSNADLLMNYFQCSIVKMNQSLRLSANSWTLFWGNNFTKIFTEHIPGPVSGLKSHDRAHSCSHGVLTTEVCMYTRTYLHMYIWVACALRNVFMTSS